MGESLFNKRNAFYIIGSVILLIFMYFECFVHPDKDFDVFIGASKLILDGKTCYDVWIPVGGSFLLYYYSPLFALLLSPFSYLPQYLNNIIWFLANLWFLYRIVKLLEYYLKLSDFSKRNSRIFISLVLLVNLRFLLYNFDLGQMTIFLVFVSLESIRLINEGKKVGGAALLALAINIKLLPLTLLFYLIYRAEYKASLFVVSFILIFLVLPSVFIGVEFNNTLLVDWWNIMTKTVNTSIVDDTGRPSLSSFIPALLMDSNGAITLPRNLLSLSIETTTRVLNIVRMLLIISTLFFIKSKPFKQNSKPFQNYYSLAYILLITPLIFPHQGMYSFFYMTPAFSYSIYFVFRLLNWEKKFDGFSIPLKYKVAIVGLVISFLLTTLTTSGFIGRGYSSIAEYYHLITVGVLILIIPLAIFNPNGLIDEEINTISK